MKKLYRKGSVHPSPQIKSQDQLLSLLPATILSLTAMLSPEDREILSYLISSNNTQIKSPNFDGSSGKEKKNRTGKKTEHTHPRLFDCDCFSCYKNYWIRWDSSPNRHLIHEIIEAFEDGLESEKKKINVSRNGKMKKDRRKKLKNSGGGEAATSSGELTRSNDSSQSSGLPESAAGAAGGDTAGEDNGSEKGSMKRFVSFIGDRVFGAWQ